MKKSQVREPRSWVIAPTFPLVLEDWRIALDLFRKIIIPSEVNVSERRISILLGDGRAGEIEFKSAERGAEGLRGAGLTAALLDEAAIIPRDAWESGVRPALSIEKGKAIFLSTPQGKNWFYDAWRRGQGEDPEWRSWIFPSNTNPYFPKEEWDQLERTTPQLIWAREFMAQFTDDASSVFHGLDRMKHSIPRDPQENERYVLGVDLAKSIDWTAIIVMTIFGECVYIHRSKDLDWSLQKQRIEYLYKRYKGVVSIDSSGLGDPIEEDLYKSGVNTQGVKTNSAKQKQEIIENLIVAVEQGLISIPNRDTHPDWGWLWDELHDFGYKILDSGHVRYEAPEKRHDDGVIALALAAWAARYTLGSKPAEKPSDNPYTTWKEYNQITNPKRPRKWLRGRHELQPYIAVRIT